MSLRLPFPFSNSGRQPAPPSPELAALLDGLINPALLVDASDSDSANWTIRLANKRAAELCQYPAGEMENLALNLLIPGIHLAGPPRAEDTRPISPEVQTANLARRDGSPLAITLSCTLLASNTHLALLHLQPAIAKPEAGRKFEKQLDALLQITESWQHRDILPDEQIASLGPDLTGAETVVVYRASSSAPVLQRTAGCGNFTVFPEILPAQDLAYLKSATLWTPGTRTLSGLHRAARNAQFNFLASAPIGQANAAIGLVAAGAAHPPEPSAAQAVRFLAAALAGFSQRQSTQNAMEADLDTQRQELLVRQVEELGAQEGIVILAPDLSIQSLNFAAETTLGYSCQTVRGQPAQNLLIGSEALFPALEQAQAGATIYKLTKQHLYRRSGELFQANLRVLPVKDGAQVIAIVVFIIDLSEQEAYKQQAQRLENQALLGEVMAVFAHEVRNPINNISTGLQVMAFQLPEGNPNHEIAQRLQGDCDRLTELMKSVLAFSKPTEYDLIPLDVEPLLVFMLERQQPKFKAANVQSRLQAPANCPQVLGNARALEQVFANLIQNATQAMSPKGGQLAVRIQAPDEEVEGPGYVTISVADTGPGIPKEDQEKIFTPFFTTKRDGTGLGLPITQRIVIAHRGNIRVESFPGGTVFTVELPAFHPNA